MISQAIGTNVNERSKIKKVLLTSPTSWAYFVSYALDDNSDNKDLLTEIQLVSSSEMDQTYVQLFSLKASSTGVQWE